MASFNRSDYQLVYEFALSVYLTGSPSPSLLKRAIQIMDIVEECIGQQSTRPEISRRKS